MVIFLESSKTHWNNFPSHLEHLGCLTAASLLRCSADTWFWLVDHFTRVCIHNSRPGDSREALVNDSVSCNSRELLVRVSVSGCHSYQICKIFKIKKINSFLEKITNSQKFQTINFAKKKDNEIESACASEHHFRDSSYVNFAGG